MYDYVTENKWTEKQELEHILGPHTLSVKHFFNINILNHFSSLLIFFINRKYGNFFIIYFQLVTPRKREV